LPTFNHDNRRPKRRSQKSNEVTAPFRAVGSKEQAPRLSGRKASKQTETKVKVSRRNKLLIILITILACLIAFCVLLYPVAKDAYLAWRDQARQAVVLAAYQARNAAISSQNQQLQTPQGITDQSRSQLGMTAPGEQLANIGGLSDSAGSNLGNLPANVDPSKLDITPTWLSELGDFIFGYQADQDGSS
jgi:cell division protein FtsB